MCIPDRCVLIMADVATDASVEFIDCDSVSFDQFGFLDPIGIVELLKPIE